jgi:hypothetical protein
MYRRKPRHVRNGLEAESGKRVWCVSVCSEGLPFVALYGQASVNSRLRCYYWIGLGCRQHDHTNAKTDKIGCSLLPRCG